MKQRQQQQPPPNNGKCFLNFRINICQSTISDICDLNVLCVDSGASVHVVSDLKLFRPKSLIRRLGHVTCADGSKADIKAVGDINIHNITLYNVLYVPLLKCNLISVPQLDIQGYSVTFSDGKCLVLMESV